MSVFLFSANRTSVFLTAAMSPSSNNRSWLVSVMTILLPISPASLGVRVNLVTPSGQQALAEVVCVCVCVCVCVWLGREGCLRKSLPFQEEGTDSGNTAPTPPHPVSSFLNPVMMLQDLSVHLAMEDSSTRTKAGH